MSTKEKVRLSRKAQEQASSFAGRFDELIRLHAALLAEADHQEFATEKHVAEAYHLVILKLAANFSVPE